MAGKTRTTTKSTTTKKKYVVQIPMDIATRIEKIRKTRHGSFSATAIMLIRRGLGEKVV